MIIGEPTYDGEGNGLANLVVDDLVNASTNWHVKMQPTARYSLLNLQGNCNEDYDQSTCYMYCRYQQIAADCQCRLSYIQPELIRNHYDSSLPICTLDRINQCVWSGSELKNCLENCRPACSQTAYALVSITNDSLWEVGDFTLTAHVIVNKYVAYMQLKTFTWDIILVGFRFHNFSEKIDRLQLVVHCSSGSAPV